MPKVVMLIIAFFIPPLAVFLCEGLNKQFWISLVLTLLCGLPGVIYAFYLILTNEYDAIK